MSFLSTAPLCLEKTALSADGIVARGRSVLGLEPEEDHTVRNTAMGIAGAYPLAVGVMNRRGASPKPHSTYQNLDDLLGKLQEGDVLLSGTHHVSLKDGFKVPITVVSGDSDYQHVSSYAGNSSGERTVREAISQSPIGDNPIGGFVHPERNVRVLRPKNPKDASRILQHMEIAGDMGALYTDKGGVRAGLKSLLLPDFISKRIGNKYVGNLTPQDTACTLQKTGPFCSSSVATAMPEVWGKNPGDVLPADILHNKAFDTIGEYKPSVGTMLGELTEKVRAANPSLSADAAAAQARKIFRRDEVLNKLLKASPTAARLGIGAGAAGLIHMGAKALDPADNLDPSAVAGAGLLAAGVTPLVAPKVVGALNESRHRKLLQLLDADTRREIALGTAPAEVAGVLQTRLRNFADVVSRRENIRNLGSVNIGGRSTHRSYSPEFRLSDAQLDNSPEGLRVSVTSPATESDVLFHLGKADYYKGKNILDHRDTMKALSSRGTAAVAAHFAARDLEAANNAVRYAYRGGGVRNALRTAGDLKHIYANSILARTLGRPGVAALTSLGGAGLLGYNLLTDKKED